MDLLPLIVEEYEDKSRTYKYIDTTEFSFFGQVDHNDKFQGFGMLHEKLKDKFYEGQFTDGLKHGKGRSYIFKGPNKGHMYEG